MTEEEDNDPRIVPLAFAAGACAAFLGHLLGDHEAGLVYHLPHQALIAIPLGIAAALALRADGRGIVVAALASLGGFAAAALVVAVA